MYSECFVGSKWYVIIKISGQNLYTTPVDSTSELEKGNSGIKINEMTTDMGQVPDPVNDSTKIKK